MSLGKLGQRRSCRNPFHPQLSARLTLEREKSRRKKERKRKHGTFRDFIRNLRLSNGDISRHAVFLFFSMSLHYSYFSNFLRHHVSFSLSLSIVAFTTIVVCYRRLLTTILLGCKTSAYCITR